MWMLVKFGFAFGIGLALSQLVWDVLAAFVIFSYIILVPEGVSGLGL
jgi:hypothetical protein